MKFKPNSKVNSSASKQEKENGTSDGVVSVGISISTSEQSTHPMQNSAENQPLTPTPTTPQTPVHTNSIASDKSVTSEITISEPDNPQNGTPDSETSVKHQKQEKKKTNAKSSKENNTSSQKPTEDTTNNDDTVEYKNFTSWVTVFLMFIFTGALVGGIWFYMNFIYELPEASVATLHFEALEELNTKYEPQDIRSTKFINHDKNFDMADLRAQSYMYSRDQVLYISLFSGLGDVFGISDGTYSELVARVADTYSNTHLRGLLPIKNLKMIGNSIFVVKPNFSEFQSTQLAKTQNQYDISDEALGWLIYLETEWAKHFQYSKVFGETTDSEYALYRVLGSIMIHSATKQSTEWLKEDRIMTPAGEYVMATAFLNLSDTLAKDSLAGMSGDNPFQNEEEAAQLKRAANTMFENATTPTELRDIAIACTMMGIYGSIDASAQDTIIERLKHINQRLTYANPQSIQEQSWAVIAYIEIGKRLNDPNITDKGWEIYEKKIRRLYLPDVGLFYEQNIYTIGEINALLQMLNRINEVGGQYWNQGEIEKFKLESFESLVNQSKLQRSHLPEEEFPVPEKLFSEEWEYYDTVKEASKAGGEFGKPPITGFKVWNKEGRWMMFDDKYISEDGLYFAYTLMTMSSDYFSDVKNWSKASTAKVTTLQ